MPLSNEEIQKRANGHVYDPTGRDPNPPLPSEDDGWVPCTLWQFLWETKLVWVALGLVIGAFLGALYLFGPP